MDPFLKESKTKSKYCLLGSKQEKQTKGVAFSVNPF